MKLLVLNAMEKLAKQEPTILKKKPNKSLENDPVFQEAYQTLNATRRNSIHRSREEHVVSVNDGKFFILLRSLYN